MTPKQYRKKMVEEPRPGHRRAYYAQRATLVQQLEIDRDYWKEKALTYAKIIDDLMQERHERQKVDELTRQVREEYCTYYYGDGPCPSCVTLHNRS